MLSGPTGATAAGAAASGAVAAGGGALGATAAATVAGAITLGAVAAGVPSMTPPVARVARSHVPTRLRAYKNASTAPRATSTRLGAFRCHLMARGVAVMPASARWNYAYGSNRAGAPGSCMVQ